MQFPIPRLSLKTQVCCGQMEKLNTIDGRVSHKMFISILTLNYIYLFKTFDQKPPPIHIQAHLLTTPEPPQRPG